MTPDEFHEVLNLTLGTLNAGGDEDWTRPVGSLEWSCWQTVEHVIDCLHSYSLQLAARAEKGFLPFSEMHALRDARTADLLAGLQGIGTIFHATSQASPAGNAASDGVVSMGVSDWCARAAFETALHTYDVSATWREKFELPSDLCRPILDSQSLWMLDRTRAEEARDPWSALLRGSGR